MINYLLSEREGRCLVVGVAFFVLGLAAMFLNSEWSRYLFYISMIFSGYFAAKDAVVDTFKERRPNVDLLMILSALGATLINYEAEGAVLLIIFAGAEVLEEFATAKSTGAISELMNQVPQTACLVQENGEVIDVSTDELKVGQRVLVQKGEQIPIDGYIDRISEVNESSLTGESIPVVKKPADEVYAGTINEGNAFQIEVNKLSSETIFSNIIRKGIIK